jgi:hypothetical protein
VCLNARGSEGFAVKRARGIIAKLAHVAGAHAPALAGHHGGGDLATGKYAGVAILGFGPSGGKVRQWDDGVGCVKTYADKIDL